MLAATSLPLWSVALVLAAIAPFIAKVVASTFERRARTRSKRLLAGAADVSPVSDRAPRPDVSEGTS